MRMIGFLWVIIEHFYYSPSLEKLRAEISPSRRFAKGWITLTQYIKLKGYYDLANIYEPIDRRMNDLLQLFC